MSTSPSVVPSGMPSGSPTAAPTTAPSATPTKLPAAAPTLKPSPAAAPTRKPTKSPTTSAPSHTPSVVPSTADTVSVDVSLSLTADAAPTASDTAAMKTFIASETGVDEANLNGFAITHTVSSRRRTRRIRRSLLATYTWTVSFTVTVSLASTTTSSASEFTSFMADVLESDSFASGITSAVPSVSSVDSVSATDSSSAARSDDESDDKSDGDDEEGVTAAVTAESSLALYLPRLGWQESSGTTKSRSAPRSLRRPGSTGEERARDQDQEGRDGNVMEEENDADEEDASTAATVDPAEYKVDDDDEVDEAEVATEAHEHEKAPTGRPATSHRAAHGTRARRAACSLKVWWRCHAAAGKGRRRRRRRRSPSSNWTTFTAEVTEEQQENEEGSESREGAAGEQARGGACCYGPGRPSKSGSLRRVPCEESRRGADRWPPRPPPRALYYSSNRLAVAIGVGVAARPPLLPLRRPRPRTKFAVVVGGRIEGGAEGEDEETVSVAMIVGVTGEEEEEEKQQQQQRGQEAAKVGSPPRRPLSRPGRAPWPAKVALTTAISSSSSSAGHIATASASGGDTLLVAAGLRERLRPRWSARSYPRRRP